jgi:hypothetical protein
MTKKLLLFAAFAVLASTQAARPQTKTPTPSLKDCECKTCLIENGKCVRTHTSAEREGSKAQTRIAPETSGKPSKEH